MTNTKTTERAVLASVMSLLLCISMLVGSTFAWFTDSASTGVGSIVAGTLDIDLVDANGDSLEGETIGFVDLDDNDLWEPGCRYTLETVKLVNNGNLNAKYKVVISATTGDVDLAEVIDVYEGETKLGTLRQFLDKTDGIKEGVIAPKETLAFGTLTLVMQETAGNEYQGKSITDISITVLATQATVEYDSEDNQYDVNAQYKKEKGAPITVETLLNKIKKSQSGIVDLSGDVIVSEPITIDGNVTLTSDVGAQFIYDESYNGSMFNITGSLTLNGVGVNGGNEWSFKDPTVTASYTSLSALDIATGLNIPGAQIAENMIVVDGGTLTVDGGAVINNIYSGFGWASGANQTKILYAKNGATVNLNDTTVTNTLGAFLYADASTVVLDGLQYVNNYASANKGGAIDLQESSIMTMKGNTNISNNSGYVRSGFIGVCSKSQFIMESGTISNNICRNGGGRACGAIICMETNGDFTMNGGSITGNTGMLAVIASRWTETSNYNGPTVINLNAGEISGNATGAASWKNATLFVRSKDTTIGASMNFTGDVVLDQNASNFINNGTINGNVTMNDAAAVFTNNGTVTGAINQYVAP